MDTVICDGEVVMLHGTVEGQEEVVAAAREAVADLFGDRGG